MTRILVLGLAGLVTAGQSQLPPPRKVAPTTTAPAGKAAPSLTPIAETKLLMEGLAQPNYKGVEKILRQAPQDEQAWKFGRGQALLLAETANLLMLRPPKMQGQEAWFVRAMEMREAATQLA